MRILLWSARPLCYNYTIQYRKGSANVVADALSQQPSQGEHKEVAVEDEFVCLLSPMGTISELQEVSATDNILPKVMEFASSPCPHKSALQAELMPYFHIRAELSVVPDLLYRGDRIMVPSTLNFI